MADLSLSLARLGAVAELLSLAAGEMFALAGLCGDGVRIGIDGRFETLSLTSALPAGAARGQLIAELTRRDRLFGDRCQRWLGGSDGLVELEQGRAHLSFALITTADLEALRKNSHAGDAVDRAAELLDGRALTEVIDRFRPPAHHSWELAFEPGDPAPLAEALEIRQSQRQLLADLASIMAPARLAIRVGPGVLFPELHVGYRDVAVEPLIRLLVGLEIHRDPGASLGRFLGALGHRDRAPRVDLAVNADGPPRLRIAAHLKAAQ